MVKVRKLEDCLCSFGPLSWPNYTMTSFRVTLNYAFEKQMSDDSEVEFGRKQIVAAQFSQSRYSSFSKLFAAKLEAC